MRVVISTAEYTVENEPTISLCLSLSADQRGEGESVESGRLGWKRASSKDWSGRGTAEGGKQHQQVRESSSRDTQTLVSRPISCFFESLPHK